MVEKKARKKRNRATALVMNGGRLLLVRERGAKHWSLPGGGMKKGEDAVTAATRELDEETRLVATSAAYLFHYESPSQHHHVCQLDSGRQGGVAEGGNWRLPLVGRGDRVDDYPVGGGDYRKSEGRRSAGNSSELVRRRELQRVIPVQAGSLGWPMWNTDQER